LLQTIDLNLFIAKKIRLGVHIGWIGNTLNEGVADIIIDDRLIDIKYGLRINGKNTENITQLLFYYFMIQLTINHLSEEQRNNNHKINKIGFYYAAYNKLIEVEVNKLIPNINIILKLIKQLLIQGNVRIREIIKHSIITRYHLNVITDEQIKSIDEACIEIEKIEFQRNLLKLKEETEKIKAHTEIMKAKIKEIKEYKELGFTNEDIKKLLGL
jgi:hypothetical protein